MVSVISVFALLTLILAVLFFSMIYTNSLYYKKNNLKILR